MRVATAPRIKTGQDDALQPGHRPGLDNDPGCLFDAASPRIGLGASKVKVTLIQDSLIPEQSAHWEQVQGLGVDLHLIGTLRSPKQDWWQTGRPNLRTTIVKPAGITSRSNTWWLYRGITKLIKADDPDLVHVALEPWSLIVAQALRAGRPSVAHAADNIWTSGNQAEKALRLNRARSHLGRLAGMASWNQAGLTLSQEYGLTPSAPTAVFPSRSVDPEVFRFDADSRDTARKEFGMDGKEAIGYVGRLSPQKGVGWLVDAVKSCTRPDVALFVAGSGPEMESLRRRASSLGERVTFLGSLPASGVPRFMAALDVLAVPSLTTPTWTEQFGRVVVEGMFAGTPVVVSDSGALPEVVGPGGVVVEEGNVAGLAVALEDALAKRKLWSERALQWGLEQYHPSVLARKAVGLWMAVVRNGNR